MRIIRVGFSADTTGFYITPMIAIGNSQGQPKALWIGWGFWLFTIEKA